MSYMIYVHLDRLAWVLKLSNDNSDTSDVDQADVGFFKMGDNLFWISGVRLEDVPTIVTILNFEDVPTIVTILNFEDVPTIVTI